MISRTSLPFQFFIPLLILLFSAAYPAEGAPLVLTEGKSSVKDTVPGRLVVCPVMVRYEGSGPAELTADVRLPEGWRLLSGAEVLSFKEAGAELLLVSFLPPGNTPAGSYTASLVVRGGEDGVKATLDLPLKVLPVMKMECVLLKQPDYILAGEAYRVVFACSNPGNVPITAEVKAVSGSGFDIRTETSRLAILSGETVRLAVVVDTPINLYTQVKHSLQLKLLALEDETVRAQASSRVDIIPRTTGRESRYNTILGEVSSLGVLRHGDTDVFGLEAGVTGQGFLDDEKETFLLFRFKDVLAGEGILIPERKDYLVRVEGAGYSAGMGTQFYSLSPLTEASAYGTGVSLSKDFGPLSISGFAVDGLLEEVQESRYASRLSYRFGDRGRGSVNILEASEDGRWTAGSMQGHFLSPSGDRLEGEYAFSSGRWADEAYYLSTGGGTDIFSYSLKYLYSGPRYRGSLEDQEQLLASVSYKPVRDISVRASTGSKTYELDREFPGATDFSRIGLSWSGVPGVLLTTNVQKTKERNREASPEEWIEAESMRIGLTRNTGPVDLQLAYEFGDQFEFIEDERSFSERLTTQLDVSSDLLGDLGASLGWYFRDGSSDKTPYSDFSLTWKRDLSSRADLTAEYRTVNSDRSYYQGADRLMFRLNFSFPNQSDLFVAAEYRPDRRAEGAEDLKVSVGYSSPFSIPVSVKKNIGRIEGKVTDALTGQAVPDVVLRLGNAVAATDSFGKYAFHSLMPEVHRLYIDPASLPKDYIPAEPMPIEVDVSDTTAEKNIRITRAARVSGRVVMYRFDRNYRMLQGGQGAAYVDPRGVPGVLLAVRTEDGTVRRALTEEDGRFDFPPLAPIEWMLRVPKDIVPDDHFLEQEKFEFVLEPGQKEEIVIKIFPKVRQIRFIDEGTVTEEENLPEEMLPEDEGAPPSDQEPPDDDKETEENLEPPPDGREVPEAPPEGANGPLEREDN